MKLLLSLLLLMSSSVFASEIVLVQNGLRSSCKSNFDVFQTLQKGSAYKITNPTIVDAGRTIELTVDLTFLKCVKKGEEFKYVVDADHMSSSYEMPQMDGSSISVTRTDLEKRLIVMNEEVKIISKVNVDENLGVQTITLEIPKPFISRNEFPRANQYGKYTVNVGIQSKTKIVSSTTDFGSTLTMGGMYRVFFDL